MSDRRARVHRMAARAAAAASLLLAVGCIHFGRLPNTEIYRLAEIVPPDGVAPAAAGLAAGSVAIAPYATPGIYHERQIVYRVDGAGYGSYAYREWAIPLGEMLGMLTESVLQRSPVVAGSALYDPPSTRQFAYRWRGTVREFEEVNRGKAVFAVVRLDVQILRAADDFVVWSGTRRMERAVPDATMPAIVEALSTLAAESVQSLAEDAKKALPSVAARDSSARP